MAAPTKYERLPGRGRRTASFAISATRSSLWLGDDHLLSLESTVAAEEYRRFYYRDVEAIIIRRTSRRGQWNLALGLFVVISAGPFFWAWERNRDEIGWLIAALSVGGFWLLIALINTLRGPTCTSHIRTAVQIEMLPSLGRLSTTRKALARLVPRIEEAQGVLTPEQIRAVDWSAASPHSVPEPIGREGAWKPPRHESGRQHVALFILLLVEAAVTLGALFVWPAVLLAISMALTLATLILLLFALRRQTGSDLPPFVKNLTWGVLGYLVLGFFVSIAFSAVHAVRHPTKPPPTNPAAFRDDPGFRPTTIAASVLAALLGVSGLLALQMRRRDATPPPLP